jgi:hypothetical protein
MIDEFYMQNWSKQIDNKRSNFMILIEIMMRCYTKKLKKHILKNHIPKIK